ncbi:MAG: macro domain-containing protein [bacterium]
MINIIEGDLLQANTDIIGHQTNCVGVFGAGIAKQIAKKYPYVKKEYTTYCKQKKPKELLGTYQISKTNSFLIANLFGQLHYGRYGEYYSKYKRQTRYNMLKSALESLHNDYPTQAIALPYQIGCGLAGGNWEQVKAIIDDVFNDSIVYLYKYNPKK